jgi:hypothetical protein
MKSKFVIHYADCHIVNVFMVKNILLLIASSCYTSFVVVWCADLVLFLVWFHACAGISLGVGPLFLCVTTMTEAVSIPQEF